MQNLICTKRIVVDDNYFVLHDLGQVRKELCTQLRVTDHLLSVS